MSSVLDVSVWAGRACLIGGQLVTYTGVRVLSSEVVECRVPLWQQARERQEKMDSKRLRESQKPCQNAAKSSWNGRCTGSSRRVFSPLRFPNGVQVPWR